MSEENCSETEKLEYRIAELEKTIEQSAEAIETLSVEKSNLTDDNLMLNTNLNTKETELQLCLDRLAHHTEEMEMITQEYEKTARENSELQSTLELSDPEQLKQLQEDLAQEQEKREIAETQMVEFKTNVKNKIDAHRLLQEQEEEKRDAYEMELTNKIGDLEATLQEKEQLYSTVTGDIKRVEERATQYKQENETMKSKVGLVQQYEEENESLKKELDSVKESVLQQKKVNEELTTESANTVNQLNAEIIKLGAQLEKTKEKLEKEQEAQDGLLAQKEKQVQDAEMALRSQANLLKEAQAQVAKLKSESTSYIGTARNNEDEKNKLTKELTEVKAEMKKLNNKLTDALGQAKSGKNKVKKLEASYKILQGEFKSAKQEVKDVKSDRSKVKGELRALKGKYKTMQEETDVKKLKENAEATEQRLKDEIKRIKANNKKNLAAAQKKMTFVKEGYTGQNMALAAFFPVAVFLIFLYGKIILNSL